MSDDPLAPVEGGAADDLTSHVPGEDAREPEVLGAPWGSAEDPTSDAIAAVAAGAQARAALIEAAPILDEAVRKLVQDVDVSQDVTEAQLDARAATDPEGPRATPPEVGRPADTARRELISE